MRTILALSLVMLSLACGERSHRGPLDPAARRFLNGFADVVDDGFDAGWPRRIRRTRDGGVMILIPSGTFLMGRAHPEDRNLNDTPRHRVTLTTPYYLDRTELTVGQWKRFVAATQQGRGVTTDGQSDDEPARGLRPEDASAYARWVGCRLPSEAEWERAARGGKEGWRYTWGQDDDVTKRNGAGQEDGFEDVAPVASFPPNALGLHDMSGNVWEWCSDVFEGGYGTGKPVTDPEGLGTGDKRSIRGGSHQSGKSRLRISYREGWLGHDPIGVEGCRLARTAK